MSDMKTIELNPVVEAFMKAQSTARLSCLIQVRVDDIVPPRGVDNSLVGTTAPGGYTRMPVVQRSIHDTHEAGARERSIYQRLQQHNMGEEPGRALFKGLAVNLTAQELAVVSTWNDLVQGIQLFEASKTRSKVPAHWNNPPVTP